MTRLLESEAPEHSARPPRSEAKGEAADRAGERGPASGRHHAFVSYARRPADQRFVDELRGELERRGKQLWIDRSDIPPGADWLARIVKGISESSALIFVLTPSSAASTVCRQELAIALEQNKRVIPLLREHVDGEHLPPTLAKLNWISFTDGDDRDAALGQLVDTIETDLAWRDEHTRITIRMREWLDSGHDGSFLLRGRDLRAAEAWYADREGHRESPVPGQIDYIIASRHAVTARQRLTLAGVSAALAVAVVLALFALIQRGDAVHQAGVALSRQLAAESASAGSSDVRLQSLLALEAYSRSPTTQARSAVIGAIEQPLEATMPGVAGAQVEALAESPDGRILAAASSAGLELWSVPRRTLIAPPLDPGDRFFGVAFSRDGRRIAVTGIDRRRTGVAILYRVADREPIGRVALDSEGTSVAFSRSDAQVAIATDGHAGSATGPAEGGRLYLWNVGRGRPTDVTVAGANSSALSVQFSPDGTRIGVSGATLEDNATGQAGFVKLYRAVPALPTVEAFSTGTGGALDIAWGPGGGRIAAALDSGVVEFLGTAADRSVGEIPLGRAVRSVAYNAAGTLLATGDSSGAVRMWSATAPYGPVGQAMQDGSIPFGLAFAPGGRTLAAGGLDGAIFLWDASSAAPIARTIDTGEALQQSALDAAAGELVTMAPLGPGGGGIVRARRLVDGAVVGERSPVAPSDTASPDAASPATALASDPAGGRIAVGLYDGDVLIEPATLRGRARALALPAAVAAQPVTEVAFSHDGRRLAVGLDNGQTVLWSVSPLRELRAFPAPPTVLDSGDPGIAALAFNPAGTALVVTNGDGGNEVFDPADPAAPGRVLDSSEELWSVAFAPDGRTLVAGDNAGNVEVFAVSAASRPDFERTGTLDGDGNAVLGVALSADGQTLATAGASGAMALWDLAGEQQLGVAVPAGAPLQSVAFAAGSDELVSTDADGIATIWPPLLLGRSLAAVRREICPRLSANLSPLQWNEDVPGEPYRATCARPGSS